MLRVLNRKRKEGGEYRDNVNMGFCLEALKLILRAVDQLSGKDLT